TLSLGQFNDALVTDQLAKVAERNVNDSWFRMAVLSANNGASYNLLSALRKRNSFFAAYSENKGILIKDLAFVLTRKDQDAPKLIADLANISKEKGENKWLMSALEGVKNASGEKGVQNQQIKTSLEAIMESKADDSVKTKISELLKI
ncbi:MAG: hypothetical protein ACRDE7_14525, partial [Sphingobacterium sp.]